jgi:hypothetical protein
MTWAAGQWRPFFHGIMTVELNSKIQALSILPPRAE